MMLSAFLRPPAFAPHGDEANLINLRYTIVRYLNLMNSLVLQSAGKYDEPPFTSAHYIAKGMVTADEWAELERQRCSTDGARISIVLLWISSLLRQCATQGFFTQPEVMLPTVQRSLSKIQQAVGEINMHITCQIPFIFVQIVSFTTHVFMFFYTSLEAYGLYEATSLDSVVDKTSGIFWAYLLVGAFTICFEGLLVMNVLLENPFGNDPTDFIVEQYADQLWSKTHALHYHANRLPFMINDDCMISGDDVSLARTQASHYLDGHHVTTTGNSWWWTLAGVKMTDHPLRISK
jgi:hypothetical protein